MLNKLLSPPCYLFYVNHTVMPSSLGARFTVSPPFHIHIDLSLPWSMSFPGDTPLLLILDPS